MIRRYTRTQTCSVILLSAVLTVGTNLSVLAQTAVSAAQPVMPAATTAAPAAAAPAPAPASTSTSITPAAAAPTPAAAAAAATPTGPADPPRAEMIHRTLYAIYDKQDNHDLALAELDELMRLRPTDPVFPFAYGNMLMKDQKWTDAVPRFEAAAKIDPTFSNAYCGIGDCQMKLKEYTKAIESYTLASRNAKAGQNFASKLAIARQYQERKQQEEDFNAAVNKLNGPKAVHKAVVKKKP
jgi:tetratricopeptide (TPR) repeat protein